MTTVPMLQIQSSVFGEIEIESNRVIYFKDGIPGLEQINEFIFFTIEEFAPITWMMSLDGAYHFPVVTFNKIDLNDLDSISKVRYLGEINTLIESDEDLVPYIIIKLNPEIKTVSLKAPILVNVSEQTGRQVILEA